MPKLQNLTAAAALFALLLTGQHSVQAQTTPAPITTKPAASQPAAPQTSGIAMAPAQALLTVGQLDALVAPIALYPDNLLSLVMMASTYPLEVVQADRFVKENSKLSAEALKAAVDKQNWDDAVKALTATPDVLALMSSKLEWTESLGNAVLAQQTDVMDAVQRLRAKADANNKLVSNEKQTVVRQPISGGGSGSGGAINSNTQYYAIEPTNPETLYVPYYDPNAVYGTWAWADYPPYYWDEAYWPGYYPGAGLIGAGLIWGAGWALGHWGNHVDHHWGGNFNWNSGNIIAGNRPQVNPLSGSNYWQHNPAHRGNVGYNNPRVEQRFGGNSNLAGNRERLGAGAAAGIGAGIGAGLANRPGAKAGQLPGGKNAGKGTVGQGGGKNAAQRPAGSGGSKAAQRPANKGGAKAAQRPSGGSKQAQRPSSKGNQAAQRPGGGNKAAQRPSGGNRQAARPSAPRGPSNAMARGGPSGASMGGGGFGGRGGGGFSGGGRSGGGGGGRGGGRRSDMTLKHDIVLLGQLQNGLGYYRFSYIGEERAYVGVMAQEVETVMPSAVVRGSDGYLRVSYEKLGLRFSTYKDWLAEGGRMPATR